MEEPAIPKREAELALNQLTSNKSSESDKIYPKILKLIS